MNNKSMYWGIGITVLWLVVIFLFWFFGDLDSPDSLNELGDFLAGIFAPVAFLWLVLGYIQQGQQLEQNSITIDQQLQEFKRLITYQELEASERRQSCKPLIEFRNFVCKIHEIPNQSNRMIQFSGDVINIGLGDAVALKVKDRKVKNPICRLQKIKVDQEMEIEFSINDNLDIHKNFYTTVLDIEYSDMNGWVYSTKFKIIIFLKDKIEIRYKVLIMMI